MCAAGDARSLLPPGCNIAHLARQRAHERTPIDATPRVECSMVDWCGVHNSSVERTDLAGEAGRGQVPAAQPKRSTQIRPQTM